MLVFFAFRCGFKFLVAQISQRPGSIAEFHNFRARLGKLVKAFPVAFSSHLEVPTDNADQRMPQDVVPTSKVLPLRKGVKRRK